MADVRTLALEIRADTRQALRELREVRGEVGRFGTGAQSSARRVDRLRTASTGATTAVRGLVGALVAVGAVQAVRTLVRTAVEVERLERRFTAATGSIEAGRREMAFVRDEADRLGLNLRQAADDFSALTAAARGTALEGQETRNIFTAVAEAATALGLDAQKTGGALTAIEQIISKGTVSAEELRQQLGERLPGAFQIAARSVGVTTEELDKLLQQGALGAEDFLPRFADELRRTFGEQAVASADSATAAFNRMDTALFDLNAELGQALLPTFTEATRVITEGLRIIRADAEGLENDDSIPAWGEAAITTFAFVADAARTAAAVIDFGFSSVGEALGASAAAATAALQGETDRADAILEDFFARQGQRNADLLAFNASAFRDAIDRVRAGRDGGGAGAAPTGANINLNIPDRPALNLTAGNEQEAAATRAATEALRERNRVLAEGARVTAGLRTEQEIFVDRVDELQRLLDEGAISLQTYTRGVEAAKQELASAGDQAEDAGDELSQFAIQAARNMQTAFADFLFDPFDQGLRGMADSFVTTLRRMAAEAAAAQIFASIGTAAAGGGFGGTVASFFQHDGGLAGSGPAHLVPAAAFVGAPRLHSGGLAGLRADEVPTVLQRGEEVLTESDPRHRAQGGGRGVTVVQNINTPDAQSFRLARAQVARDARLAVTRRT